MLQVRIAKFNTAVNVDWDALPESAKQHIIEYGLRQNLNDRIASEDNDVKGMELIRARIKALMSGEFRSTGGRESDPVVTESKRLATVAIKKALVANGHKLKDHEDHMSGYVDEYLKAHPETTAIAKANVGARQAAPVADLASLGFTPKKATPAA